MTRIAKAVLVGLIALAPFVAGGFTPASAAVRVASTVTFDDFVVGDPNITFKGAVNSKKAFCENNRKITLRQVDQGIVAGRTTSDAGKWVIRFDGTEVNPGKFKLIMERRTVKKAGKTYVCAADTHTFTVGVEN